MLPSLALFSSARALKPRAGFTVFCPTCLHCTSFASVGYFAYPLLIRAVSTTVKDSVALYSMTDYLTAAARALWGHRLFRRGENAGISLGVQRGTPFRRMLGHLTYDRARSLREISRRKIRRLPSRRRDPLSHRPYGLCLYARRQSVRIGIL